MADTLSTLSIISFIVAGVFMVLAVYLFVFFKIPIVIGDLTAKNARKSIARMRAANERTGNKSYRTSKTNDARGKITDNMPDSYKLSRDKKASNAFSNMPETGLLTENMAQHELEESTSLLNDNEATGRQDEDNLTKVLQETSKFEKRTRKKELNVVEEVLLIHTDEVIR